MGRSWWLKKIPVLPVRGKKLYTKKSIFFRLSSCGLGGRTNRTAPKGLCPTGTSTNLSKNLEHRVGIETSLVPANVSQDVESPSPQRDSLCSFWRTDWCINQKMHLPPSFARKWGPSLPAPE